MSARDELPGLVQLIGILMRDRLDAARQTSKAEELRPVLDELQRDLDVLREAASRAVDEMESDQAGGRGAQKTAR